MSNKILTELPSDIFVTLIQKPVCCYCRPRWQKSPFTVAHCSVIKKSPSAPSASGHNQLFLDQSDRYLEDVPMTKNPHLPYANCSNVLLSLALKQIKPVASCPTNLSPGVQAPSPKAAFKPLVQYPPGLLSDYYQFS